MEEKDDTTLGNEMSLEEFMQYLKSIEERSDREDELLEFYNKAWEIRLGTKLFFRVSACFRWALSLVYGIV